MLLRAGVRAESSQEGFSVRQSPRGDWDFSSLGESSLLKGLGSWCMGSRQRLCDLTAFEFACMVLEE